MDDELRQQKKYINSITDTKCVVPTNGKIDTAFSYEFLYVFHNINT